MKTKRSAAKRARVKSGGKIKVKKQGLRHLLTGRSSKEKRKKRAKGHTSVADTRGLKKSLPYG